MEDGMLKIENDQDLKSLDFLGILNINRLELQNCDNIIPKLDSKTIKQLTLLFCDISNVKDFQLENLEILTISNYSRKESDTLMQEIVKFQKLKQLYLYRQIINVNPLSQLNGLTILFLIHCEIHSTESLRTIINLQELYLQMNKGIDITALQYLTNLTTLSLESCNLLNLDSLRSLEKLEKLHIFDNKIIYLHPVLDLKQLSTLNAENNKLIDVSSIKRHQNFQSFLLDNQELPTDQELIVANILKNLNSPIISFRKIYHLKSNFMTQNYILRNKISEYMQKQFDVHSQMIARVVALFEQNLQTCQ
ncbi:leucine-rich_repeat domain-containing protein [Hexamita inflata]|uniref:Partial n=1 Tax=Hexamita inflata TaxID=28002 RepID=A0AA86P154_9EUKA|nr:leucine-rich repeat domain-containing protein [Hexamita inflata]